MVQGKNLQVKKLIKSTARALLLTIAASLSVALDVQAATTVSGAITANTTWSLAQSPYQVTADVSVESGATLTIESGVVVTFDTAKNLTITNGALSAHGTVGQPVIFTSSLDVTGGTPASGNWGQIRFLDSTNDNATILEHTNIRYGQGVTIQSASPTFNYLNISHNLGSAISIDLNSSPKGIGNQATGNTLNGISVPAGEIVGNVTWGIKGIPYIVATGVVSVGASPIIASVIPNEVQQGLFVDTVITGTRLTGADSIQFDAVGVTGRVTGAGSDTSVPVRITADATQPLGNIPFDVKTAAGWVHYANGINVALLKPTITISNITPNSMRRAETKSFQLTGASLQGAEVSVPGGLTVSNLQTTNTQASFDITSTLAVSLGSQPITVRNPAIANGTATVALTIIDAFPKVNINTIPSAVTPDAIAHPFNIALTNADSVDHTLNFSTVDPSIVTVSPASVTIPAGATTATVNIAGLMPGYTLLSISSPTLASVSKQIYSSNLVNGAVVDPLLSSVITVNVPLQNGSVAQVLSPSIMVVVPESQIGPISSSSITVVVPGAQNGSILSAPLTVNVTLP